MPKPKMFSKNPSQKSAVPRALQKFVCFFLAYEKMRNFVICRRLVLVQGPPGTGKSYTAEAILIQLLKKRHRSRILVTANTNSVVDMLCERLANLDFAPVRFGWSCKHFLPIFLFCSIFEVRHLVNIQVF